MAIQKKVCVLGAFAVGKTSLVRRYVENIFSDKYLTSFGVKVDKKQLPIGNKDVTLLLWDLYGEDSTHSILSVYLKGMAGYLLVVDPSRKSTYTSALALHELVLETVGVKPYIVVLNKCDIKEQWLEEDEEFRSVQASSVAVIETSAKIDVGVDIMFQTLAGSLVTDQGESRHAS